MRYKNGEFTSEINRVNYNLGKCKKVLCKQRTLTT